MTVQFLLLLLVKGQLLRPATIKRVAPKLAFTTLHHPITRPARTVDLPRTPSNSTQMSPGLTRACFSVASSDIRRWLSATRSRVSRVFRVIRVKRRERSIAVLIPHYRNEAGGGGEGGGPVPLLVLQANSLRHFALFAWHLAKAGN